MPWVCVATMMSFGEGSEACLFSPYPVHPVGPSEGLGSATVQPNRDQQHSQLGMPMLAGAKEVRRATYGAQRRKQMAGRKMRAGMKGGTSTNRYISTQ